MRGGLAAAALLAGPLRFVSARAQSPLFADSFARASTSRGWGKGWFNQRRGVAWGIANKKAFYDLPAPQPGAAADNPNPVVVLDHNVLDVDIKAKVVSSAAGARFGLVGRVVGYNDYYGAYIGAGKLVIARFSAQGQSELKAKAFTVKAGTAYWLRFSVSGTAPVVLRVKVWRVGSPEPGAWMLVAEDADKPIADSGSFGFLFQHDDVKRRAARVRVSNLTATSPKPGRKTRPEVTFAFAGRTQKVSGSYRTQVVTKTDIPASVVFRVGTDPRLKSFREVSPSETNPRAQVSKAWLNDLPAGSTIYWRPVATSKSGRRTVGRIRALKTPPAVGEALSFAFGSCTHPYTHSGSFSKAAVLDPFFFAHLGDLGYAENDLGGGAAMARTTGSYQDRWTRILGRESVTKLHRKAAWIMLQDDHDYGANMAWSKTVRPFTIPAFDELSGNLGDRFFDIPYGDVHCFFLDVHAHADDPFADDGPNHSLLGDNQKSWLKDAMRGSNAKLLVVFAPMALWGPGDGAANWKSAFATEREELLKFFFSVQATNRRVIVCSGNSHAQIINRHQNPDGGKDVIEFVSSGTDKFEKGVGRPVLPDGVIDPLRAMKDVNGFGYVRVTAGATPRIEMRAINSDTGVDAWAPLVLDL